MTSAEIRERIAALDASWSPPIVTVTGLKYRGGGGSGAFDADTGDDAVRYVIKAMNNNHEPQVPPLKIVATELICARLGRMFGDPLVKPCAICDIPSDIAAGVVYEGTAKHPTPGPAFGTLLIKGPAETKGPFNALPAARAAAILVFQTWLRGEDCAVLIDADDGSYWSVDHGWYLTGSQWNWNLAAMGAVTMPWAGGHITDPGYFANRELFAPTLDALASLTDEAVISALAAMPVEWGLSVDQRVDLAGLLLERRNGVEAALSALW